MQLTDTHCHIQSVGSETGEANTRSLWAKAGDTTPDDMLERAKAANVTRLICVGCDLDDSQLVVDFVKNRENCWASVGIHPHETHHYTDNPAARQQFAALALAPKVVAIGECGLDYFYEHSSKESQLALLRFQIELARAHDLPMIFHVREAFDDFWPIFESYTSKDTPIRGVLHSFTDSRENLERAMQHGLCVGVNGIATFAKKPEQIALYRTIPLNALLLETDAPFLTPVPYRGKICEPYHVRTIAEFLATERGIAVEEIAAATTRNAQQLFGI